MNFCFSEYYVDHDSALAENLTGAACPSSSLRHFSLLETDHVTYDSEQYKKVGVKIPERSNNKKNKSSTSDTNIPFLTLNGNNDCLTQGPLISNNTAFIHSFDDGHSYERTNLASEASDSKPLPYDNKCFDTTILSQSPLSQVSCIPHALRELYHHSKANSFHGPHNHPPVKTKGYRLFQDQPWHCTSFHQLATSACYAPQLPNDKRKSGSSFRVSSPIIQFQSDNSLNHKLDSDKPLQPMVCEKMPGAQPIGINYSAGGAPPQSASAGRHVVDILTDHQSDLIKTDSPNFLCTPLPQHWRVNKSLQTPFKGLFVSGI